MIILDYFQRPPKINVKTRIKIIYDHEDGEALRNLESYNYSDTRHNIIVVITFMPKQILTDTKNTNNSFLKKLWLIYMLVAQRLSIYTLL